MSNTLRRKVEEVLIVWIYMWDNDKTTTKKCSDKLMSLFSKEVGKCIPKKKRYTVIQMGHMPKEILSQEYVRGFNKAIFQMSHALEKRMI